MDYQKNFEQKKKEVLDPAKDFVETLGCGRYFGHNMMTKDLNKYFT